MNGVSDSCCSISSLVQPAQHFARRHQAILFAEPLPCQAATPFFTKIDQQAGGDAVAHRIPAT